MTVNLRFGLSGMKKLEFQEVLLLEITIAMSFSSKLSHLKMFLVKVKFTLFATHGSTLRKNTKMIAFTSGTR